MPGAGDSAVQLFVFIGLMVFVAALVYAKVRGKGAGEDANSKEVFLAGGGLSWFFVAGAITLTNLSTDQLVGMNGNQMLLLAWWELSAIVGLGILALVFVPIYYRANCTTVTQLLEKRYNQRGIRTTISALFLIGNILIYLPAVIYSGSLFMQSLFGLDPQVVSVGVGGSTLSFDMTLIGIATVFAVVGAAYAILGGLRAVAVLDTYSGVGILALALAVVFLALKAVDFDIVTGVPAERLTMIGSNDSPIPFHTLFTGMILIQIFYWSTNQNITQKALAAPTVREAQKGVLAAAAIRFLVIPAIVVVPGVVAYKLFGDVGDRAYGMLVGEVLPSWTSGMFAAMIAAAVLTTYSAVLNATTTLYTVDLHHPYINADARAGRLNRIVGIIATVIAILLVPVYANAESIINLLQQLNGLLSMPILSVFIVGLLFKNVDARAAIAGLIWGFALYAFHNFTLYVPGAVYEGETVYQHFGLDWLHYIDVMVVVLVTSVLMALAVNRLVYGKRSSFGWRGGEVSGATA